MTLEFDASSAWALHQRVSLRPESFGALAYHFGTRRLSFLKSPVLVRVVGALADHPSAEEACAAVGVEGDRAPIFKALGTLARTDMIVPRVSA